VAASIRGAHRYTDTLLGKPLRISSAFLPKQPRNLLLTLAGAATLLALCTFNPGGTPPSPKRGLGLFCGVAAAAVYVLGACHPLRRRSRRIPAMMWLQAHVYLGSLAFLAVLVHSGFARPKGVLGMALLGLSAWTFASGLLGVMLQKAIPARMADGLRVEALYERIPDLIAALVARADGLVTGAGEVLARFYAKDVRPALATPRPTWLFVLDPRAGRVGALEPLRRTRSFLPAQDQEVLEELSVILIEKLELDAQSVLQRALRGWVVAHAVPATLLLGLVAFHVWAWAAY